MKTITLLLLLIFNAINFSQYKITNAFPKLTFDVPVDIQVPPDNSNRMFIVSQKGYIEIVDNDPATSVKSNFMDIQDRVEYGGEMGLLGLAFHPDFSNNGYFFLDYTTRKEGKLQTRISRFKTSSIDPNKGDQNSEEIILVVDQPYSNHNAGQIAFGPDNYLYISMGDGGSGGDPQNHGQRRETLLGSILRIDVDNIADGLKYSIPADNPFINNNSGWREEIFAYGLRNPWRFSFDKVTGKLWTGDVGQNAWEEISIIEKGKNYGWRIMEGFNCFNPDVNCNQTGLELPVWEYGHNDQGGFSITGGFVYRGKEIKEFYGKYIYGDFVTGNIWALSYDGVNELKNEIIGKVGGISTFGIDKQDEIYFASFDGRIYKFISNNPTGLNDVKPLNFKLGQNYPNPFNPTTTIEVILDKSEFIKLSVFDTLGRKVDELFEGLVNAGVHKFIWDASNFTSGIYFYNITTAELSENKKMALVR